MSNNDNSLIKVLTAFMEDMWLPYEDSLSIINREVSADEALRRKLIYDFIETTNDEAFNWNSLAKESQLLITPENYSNEDIKNYVKFLLQDYLFPEKALTNAEIEQLNLAVEDILKSNNSNNEWMLAYDVFNELKKQEQFKQLEYYNLWKLPFVKKRIIQKCVEGKDREIGYLKYNET